MQWREDEAHSIVVQLHDEARAFAAAAASLQQVVKDRSQELEIGLVQMLDGQFHRETLIGLFKPRGLQISCLATLMLTLAATS